MRQSVAGGGTYLNKQSQSQLERKRRLYYQKAARYREYQCSLQNDYDRHFHRHHAVG